MFDGDHFGSVAIKFPKMDHIDDEKRVEAFKQETACFQNARHENLVFFVGYTMDHNRLGIVTEKIRGPSLHKVLHSDSPVGHRVDFNEVIDYAKQICQVRYRVPSTPASGHVLPAHQEHCAQGPALQEHLHRQPQGRDHGLWSLQHQATRLSAQVREFEYCTEIFRLHGFYIPENWVSYQAPEVLKSLNANLDTIFFNERTDVYAFGWVAFCCARIVDLGRCGTNCLRASSRSRRSAPRRCSGKWAWA